MTSLTSLEILTRQLVLEFIGRYKPFHFKHLVRAKVLNVALTPRVVKLHGGTTASSWKGVFGCNACRHLKFLPSPPTSPSPSFLAARETPLARFRLRLGVSAQKAFTAQYVVRTFTAHTSEHCCRCASCLKIKDCTWTLKNILKSRVV